MWKIKVPDYSNKVPPYKKTWDMELCTHFLWIGITVFVMDWKFVVVQLLSHVLLFVTPWTAAHQDSLSFTISWNLLKLMSIESVMPSNHFILWSPCSPRDSQESSPIPQFKGINSLVLSLLYGPTPTYEKTIALTRWTFVDKVMSLLFNMLSMLVRLYFGGLQNHWGWGLSQEI